MLISLNWLSRYIDLADKSVEEIAHALNMLGFEVEEVRETGLPRLDKVVVGRVLRRDQHPNADRLTVCRVDVGGLRPLEIVCGASNYRVDDRVPVALVGSSLPGGHKIDATELRGVISFGMMCSPRELGLGEDHEGLLILDGEPEIGAPINQVFPDSDTVFDLEVTPNRPDCLSHLGIGRELAAYFGKQLICPELKADLDSPPPVGQSALIKGVTTLSPDNCPNYIAYSLSGVKIAPSPEWLQGYLRAVDQRPINNVVDITNFVLLELGQPLHAFDADKIGGREIVVRQAMEGEKIVTLDNKERILNSDMLVIADAEKPLVVAGVMGSIEAEVDENTVDIVMESAYFNPSNIRKTSRQLGLSSDSSYRFERGVDPNGTKRAALRAIDLILEVAGGERVGSRIQTGSEPATERKIAITPQYIRDLAGFEFSEARVRKAFEALGCAVRERDDHWEVEPPSWRGDLCRPADLAEEFLRLYGSNHIPEAPVTMKGMDQRDDPVASLARLHSRYLANRHFQECKNYSLRSEDETSRWFGHLDLGQLRLENPIASDQTHLRVSLIPGLLDNLKFNRARDTGLERVFETGKVYHELEGRVYEMYSVAFLVHIPERTAGWKGREPFDFYSAKSLMEVLAKAAGLDLEGIGYETRERDGSLWLEGHSARVDALIVDGFEAQIGRLRFKVAKEWDLDGAVLGGSLEILPEKLMEDRGMVTYRPFSQYPPAVKDLALVVDESLLAETVRSDLGKLARQVAGNRFELEAVSVFDVYKGEGVPEGKKSLAFNLRFRAEDRTLTDAEVGEVFSALQDRIEASTPYRIRN